MAKKLLLVNLLMLAVLLFLAQHLVSSWAEFERKAALRTATRSPVASDETAETVDVPLPERPSSLAPFLTIPERNLFSESRGREDAEGVEGEEEAPPKLAILPKLISVSMFGGRKQAVLSVFEGNRGSRAENRVVDLGDQVQGYTVGRIDDTELGLFWKGAEYEAIPLDPSAGGPPRNQPAKSASAVRIITIGSAGAAVETVSVSENEEESRGVEVGVVSGQTGARGAQGVRGGQPTRGRSQLGGARGGRSGLSSTARPSTRGRGFNQGSGQAPIGLGSRQPPPPTAPPPN